MFKRSKLIFLLFLILSSFSFAATTITDINITPELDISFFGSYTIYANITNDSAITSVIVNISSINGEGVPCWDFYVNGTCGSETLSFPMVLDVGDIWKKTTIRPDYIYPEIYFAKNDITWYNAPSNIDIYRRSYHIFNFTNSFEVDNNMSFWLEFNTIPKSIANSNNLLVYLVGNGEDLSYFESDWRSKPNTELVGTFIRTDGFDHTHTENSSHRLIALSTNPDGTIGLNNINISDQFFIVLYQDATQINRGWNLRYHEPLLCNNSANWYIGDRIGGT
ncbi:MAG: hypothetical protein PHU63_03640, partial [Candidatus ainarchaeum sp.]|nr:hypothetical protein [Candidatus ainarchaeum sp.]